MRVVFEVFVAKHDLLRDALLESRKIPTFSKRAFHEYMRDSVRYFVSMRNSICRAEAELKLQAVAHDGENVDADVSDQLQRFPVTNVCKSYRFDDE